MMKKEYISPNIKMVEFKVEVGVDGSVSKVSSWGRDWSADPNGKGTEAYENNADQGSGFFGSAIPSSN